MHVHRYGICAGAYFARPAGVFQRGRASLRMSLPTSTLPPAMTPGPPDPTLETRWFTIYGRGPFLTHEDLAAWWNRGLSITKRNAGKRKRESDSRRQQSSMGNCLGTRRLVFRILGVRHHGRRRRSFSDAGSHRVERNDPLTLCHVEENMKCLVVWTGRRPLYPTPLVIDLDHEVSEC
ncbi:hypothetical protein BDN67DRAFT_321329 [Paxillus ammoniavirescens]|nr:hypothetical protein BDN67DRAFT_321329 [Paxillus ammoniavirescens]